MGVQLPSEPITRKEQYLAKAAGQAVEIPAEPITREEAYLEAIANAGGGGGGTTNYNQLSNKPQIAGTTLQGNKTLSDLGIASASALANKVDKVEGKGLSTNDYDDTEKAAVASSVKDVKVDGQSCLDSNRNAIVQITVPTEYEYTVAKVDNLTLKVTTKQNGVVTDETTYTLTGWSDPVDIDGHIQLNYNISGGTWSVKTLVASTDYPAEQTWTWVYNQTPSVPVLTFEEAENHIGLSAAYADLKTNKQDTLTFDDVPTANSDNPVKSGGVKSAIDAAVASAYHHAGTKTCAELVAGLLVAGNEGNVYNMTDSGTTTADFIEGAGQPIKAGDNVGIAKISDSVYKFDLLSGFVDTTNFVQKSETAGLLKNDGTVDTTIQGDIGTLKSGLTNLDNEVNGDATYPYADVITIPDAIPANVADCTVKIEPVQDLHGYDHPWVGGAGKNKLPLTVANLKALNTTGTWNGNIYSIANSTFEILTDDANNVTGIKINGTFNANANFIIASNYAITAGNYRIANNCSANIDSGYHTLQIFDASTTVVCGTNIDKTVELSSDTNVTARLAFVNNASVNNAVFTPILYKSDTQDSTFAPYTNYCPITGHTEASVQRDGVNIADPSKLFLFNNNTYVATNDYNTVGAYDVEPNTEYRLLSGKGGGVDQRIIFWDAEGNKITNTASSIFTTPSDCVKISFYKELSNAVQTVEEAEMMLCLSQYTSFVPYAGKTYTIALGDTIYGGTVDFDSGVMTVDRKLVDLGDYTWAPSGDNFYTAEITDFAYNMSDVGAIKRCPYFISDKYASSSTTPNIDLFFNSGYSGYRCFVNGDAGASGMTGAEFKAYVTGTHLCYELATPTTIQLTPQQIQLLKGTNTLTASTGQISVTVNGVSGAIGSVQTQANATDEALAELVADIAEQLPTAPTTDGSYVLTVTVADGTPTYSWESAT